MDNTHLFTQKAGKYASARPSYPAALIDNLYDDFQLTAESVIADIGCGTGKFSELLVKRGSFVYGIDSDEKMLLKAEKLLNPDRTSASDTDRSAASDTDCSYVPGDDSSGSHFRGICAPAEHTMLPDSSVDAVTAAQAFHWFDADAFRAECCRILRPGGRVFLIWNVRDTAAPVTREIAELYGSFSSRFHGFNNGLSENDPRFDRFFPHGYERRRFDNPLRYDRETFISRCESSSHAPAPGTPEHAEYCRQAGGIFDRLAVGGILDMANYTDIYIGDPRD